jgi:hypothetical protein
LRAGTVKDIKELNRNPWSGHSALTGKVKRKWQNTKYVLSFFGSSGNSRKNYLRYVKKGIDQGRRPELVGGGLIRSMGGWSAVLAIRRSGERELGYSGADIARYLGVTNSCVTRMISAGRKQDIDDINLEL